MSYSFTLSKPLVDHTDLVREWSVDQIRPHAREADETMKYPSNWREIMASCPVPIGSRYVRDGEAMPTFDEGYWVTLAAVYEAMSYGDLWPVSKMTTSGIGHVVVKLIGTPSQVEKWYDGVVAAGQLAVFALTEPGFGSDTSRVSTTAVRDGDSWVINGTKIYVSNGSAATYTTVFATIDKSLGGAGIRAFVVPNDTPGFTVVKNEDKLGVRCWETSELLLENCVVPLGNAVGYDDDGNFLGTTSGQGAALGALTANRPNCAVMAIGVASASIDITDNLLKGQRAGFTPQRWTAITDEIASMRYALERGRRMAYDAQFNLDAGRPDRTKAAMGKAYAPETAERVIRRCMQLLGPEGASKELLLEKWYRDCKILDIFEGSAQIQRLMIGRSMMGRAVG